MACRINAKTILMRTKLVVISANAGASESAEINSTVPSVPEIRSGVSQLPRKSAADSAVSADCGAANTARPNPKTTSAIHNQRTQRSGLGVPGFELVEHPMNLPLEITAESRPFGESSPCISGGKAWPHELVDFVRIGNFRK